MSLKVGEMTEWSAVHANHGRASLSAKIFYLRKAGQLSLIEFLIPISQMNQLTKSLNILFVRFRQIRAIRV